MKKYLKLMLLFSMIGFPTVVFASSGDDTRSFVGLLIFLTVFMSIFVLYPLAQIFAPNNVRKMFIKLFVVRLILLIFGALFISSGIAFLDLIAIFVGAFVVVPVVAKAKNVTINHKSNQVIYNPNADNNIKSDSNTINASNTDQPLTAEELKCSKCGSLISATDKVCPNCGEAVANNQQEIKPKVVVKPTDFDPIFNNSEDGVLIEFIKKEMAKISMDMKLIPKDVLRRKNILSVILGVLVFVYTSLIFFHFPIITYIVGLIILIVFIILLSRYNFMKFIMKEIKARPSEKISNVLMNTKNSMVPDNYKFLRISGIIVCFLLPMLIFINPRIIYEKKDDGYAVRFYTFGLTNFKTATIPETYRGKKVISLRGNAFSNMPLLKTVSLPDSIIEIRGQAFKNDISLENVNIPSNLQYLGGGAFYHARSIKSIELPDTLTEMGGEVFLGATHLEHIKLSNNLTEIRGDSFGYCTMLKSISIPDSVTRIGGHAFYNASSLSEVVFTPNSQLREIGSSAFRLCDSLYQITLPSGVSINERAFKESPTKIYSFNGEGEYDNSGYGFESYDDSY